MKLNRAKLIRHLQRLVCGGQVKEAVFRDGFAASALTPDQQMIVEVPDLDGASNLAEPIGIADVELFIKALKLAPGEGNTGVEVDVYVEDNRLVIDDGSRAVQRLLLASPKTIGTYIPAEDVEKGFEKLPSNAIECVLPRSVLEGAAAAYSLYKAQEIEILVSAKGSKIIVGTEKTNRAEFPLEEVKRPKEEYSLLFGVHLVDVFSVITDFSSAEIALHGPDTPILISDGDYQYMLGPRKRSVEETKAKSEVKETKRRGRKKQEKAAATE